MAPSVNCNQRTPDCKAKYFSVKEGFEEGFVGHLHGVLCDVLQHVPHEILVLVLSATTQAEGPHSTDNLHSGENQTVSV